MTFDNMKLSNRTYSNHVYSDMTLNKMIWVPSYSEVIVIRDSGTRTELTPIRNDRSDRGLDTTYRYKIAYGKIAFTPG